MRKMILIFVMIWINTLFLSGCASSKAKVFGENMPTMKTIHNKKFGTANSEPLVKPERLSFQEKGELGEDFHWLPNPTLRMYVFKHLTSAGYPVPGYSTFFRLYMQDHIAVPSELAGWE